MDSDEKMVRLLLRHPEKGLEKVMNAYGGVVYAIVYSKLSQVGNREDVEECVSDVFYVFYKNIDSIDLQRGSLKAYLAVIAKRKAIDAFRRDVKKVERECPLDWVSGDELMKKGFDSATEVEQEETKENLIRGIKELGEPDSEIFIRKYFFGQSTRIIAEELNLKENTVDKKVSRGLAKLKLSLRGEV